MKITRKRKTKRNTFCLSAYPLACRPYDDDAAFLGTPSLMTM